MNARFDISTFIKAYAASEETGKRYFECASKRHNAYNIIEAYRLSHGDIDGFGDALAHNISINGIEHFQYQEEKYAKEAYFTLVKLDREYALRSGKHLKDNEICSTHKERVNFLIAFDDAYNAYMAGGHMDYEDR